MPFSEAAGAGFTRLRDSGASEFSRSASREAPELPGSSGFAICRRPGSGRAVAAWMHAQTCGVADYGGGTSGYQTPQQALQSVLAQHHPGLSATGWKLTGRSATGARFVSGNDSVDVVKNKAGKWNVGGVTTCT